MDEENVTKSQSGFTIDIKTMEFKRVLANILRQWSWDKRTNTSVEKLADVIHKHLLIIEQSTGEQNEPIKQ